MDKRLLAKPFLKWAGGKTQLLEELASRLPQQIKETGRIASYVEPFVGGGAFFFYLRNMYTIEEAHLIDINRDLIVAYKVVQQEPEELIERLQQIESTYLPMDSQGRKEYYYKIRQLYNGQKENFPYERYSKNWLERASYLIFLNKTCYNGLFRQNQKGEFNVPHGSYKNPKICDPSNLLAVSQALEGVQLICGDFLQSRPFVRPQSLVYFDPPYRPLTSTANFTSYTKVDFDDQDQIRLARYFAELNAMGAFIMLSNSDPKVSDPNDRFFDDLYQEFVIERVLARRSINSDSRARGEITEILVRNYR